MEMLEKNLVDIYRMMSVHLFYRKQAWSKIKQLNLFFFFFFPVDYMLIAKDNLHIAYLVFPSPSSRQTTEVICLDFVKDDKIPQSILTVESFWK